MGLEAATKALLDAGEAARLLHSIGWDKSCPGITYDSIEAAHVGYCYGDSTTGQVSVLPQGDPQNTEITTSEHCITSG